MSFIAFGAGVVGAANNLKRQERAEEAAIRKEDRAFDIAKKKTAYIALQNRVTSFETAQLKFMDDVALGKVPDPDNPGMPLTINSKAYETILNRYSKKINETNTLLSGGTIPELSVEADKKTPPPLSSTEKIAKKFRQQEQSEKAEEQVREVIPRLDIGMTPSFKDIGITDPFKPEKKASIVEKITGPSLKILKGFLEPGGYSKYVGQPFANWIRSGGALEFGINTLEDLKNKKPYNAAEVIKKFEKFNYEERK
jgi:hypothetical protein